MTVRVRLELSMIAWCLPPETLTDMNNPAPPKIRPESSYQSGIFVQTTGVTSVCISSAIPVGGGRT